MTNAIQNSTNNGTISPTTTTSYSFNGDSRAEESECYARLEYLPMDVYVDPRTLRAHIQG